MAHDRVATGFLVKFYLIRYNLRKILTHINFDYAKKILTSRQAGSNRVFVVGAYDQTS